MTHCSIRSVSFLGCLYFILLANTSLHAAQSRYPVTRRALARPSKPAKKLQKKAQPKPAKQAASPAPPPAPPLKKPKLLPSSPIDDQDPLKALDALVTRQTLRPKPYVPWVQQIGIAIDYSRLLVSLLHLIAQKQALWCEGGANILLRKNVQLAMGIGHNQLTPLHTEGNNAKNTTVRGTYGRLGLDYVVHYDARNNLYLGLRYARSHLAISTEQASHTQQALQASWWELLIGSEQQLFKNWGYYIGLTLCIKGLHRFMPFAPAENYVIPGYGRTVQKVVPSGTLYLSYQWSFLKKKVLFS